VCLETSFGARYFNLISEHKTYLQRTRYCTNLSLPEFVPPAAAHCAHLLNELPIERDHAIAHGPIGHLGRLLHIRGDQRVLQHVVEGRAHRRIAYANQIEESRRAQRIVCPGVACGLEARRLVQRDEVAAADVVLPEELDALLAGAGRVHDDGVEGAAARCGDRHVVFDVDSAEIPEATYTGGKKCRSYFWSNTYVFGTSWIWIRIN
jgi:hypothetical protein